ncbi:MAG: fumarylacetoacetate hydrolase family protein [Firmicutes bacterium]|nr:fumarylacetoacetate hydrolase family protein [Bacillota bacterium]
MKLITYRYGERESVGALLGNEVAPIPQYASMLDLVRNCPLADLPKKMAKTRLPLAQVQVCAPIPHPTQDVICLGMNFADHTVEAARFHPNMVREDYPVYFAKRVNRAPGDGEEINGHFDVTAKADYEVEVAFVIRRDAYQVKPEEAEDYVFGYMILNDLSARDLQNRHKQFYLGKSLDGYTPMGPCLVTKDEFTYPPEIQLKSYVNGELRQNGNTRNWIYGIDYVIADLSQVMTLQAGTIITMGTPAGVGMGFEPPKFLKSGDVVRCEAEGLGSLTNTLV